MFQLPPNPQVCLPMQMTIFRAQSIKLNPHGAVRLVLSCWSTITVNLELETHVGNSIQILDFVYTGSYLSWTYNVPVSWEHPKRQPERQIALSFRSKRTAHCSLYTSVTNWLLQLWVSQRIHIILNPLTSCNENLSPLFPSIPVVLGFSSNSIRNNVR